MMHVETCKKQNELSLGKSIIIIGKCATTVSRGKKKRGTQLPLGEGERERTLNKALNSCSVVHSSRCILKRQHHQSLATRATTFAASASAQLRTLEKVRKKAMHQINQEAGQEAEVCLCTLLKTIFFFHYFFQSIVRQCSSFRANVHFPYFCHSRSFLFKSNQKRVFEKVSLQTMPDLGDSTEEVDASCGDDALEMQIKRRRNGRCILQGTLQLGTNQK